MSAEVGNEGTNAELTQKQLKKMQIISKSIKGQRNMITTLENAMEDQCKKLASVTKSTATGETDDDDNNGSSVEDDKSVSKSVNHDDNNELSESE